MDSQIIQRCRVKSDKELPDLTQPSHKGARSGFTIIELMIVVAIIGILAVIAIPSFINARTTSLDASFMNTLRLLGQNLEMYSMEEGRGDYPPDAPASTTPAGFENHLPRNFSWAETPPIGGTWDWDRATNRTEKVHGVYAGVSIIEPARTSAQMRRIDANIDDGSLVTGKLRIRTNGYIYIIEE